MRKLLALLGTVAITSSGVGILTDSVTLSKPITTFKTEAKKMVAMSELTTSSDVETKANEFTTTEISRLNQESQTWDNAKIDEILKESLEYHDYQLSINEKKLDMKSLPSEVSEHLDEALAKLNEVVSQGVVKVEVKDNKVELIYPDSNSSPKSSNTDDDIFYYDDPNTMRASSLYMWTTFYHPNHWWQFWKWGGYLHFSEKAIFGAKIVNTVAKCMNIVFLIKNVKEIEGTINKISSARLIGNTTKVNEGLNELGRLLGGVSLDFLGDVVDVLATLTIAINFFIGLSLESQWLLPLIELIFSITESITGKLIKADKGKGSKWQFIYLMIPGKISAE